MFAGSIRPPRQATTHVVGYKSRVLIQIPSSNGPTILATLKAAKARTEMDVHALLACVAARNQPLSRAF